MQLAYSHPFPYPRETVWKLIQDERVLRHAIPGCKSFSHIEQDSYHVEMGLSVGPVKGLFSGQVQIANRQEPGYYQLLVKGKGLPGEIDATAHMHIEETEQGAVLNCQMEVMVTGVLASVGQRVMGGVAKLVLGQFFKAAEEEMNKLASQV
ncbi:CoxG family protein [Brevibacillus sp. TJ4]|uniref:CoxG family protein n=1 Tax=Brevibacillus sp. TJ4 TaxID=3234853 RepID=UPI0037D77550